jgi:hypothetical protein
VVNLARLSVIKRENSDGFVKATSDEFTACGSKVNVQNSTDMVFVDHLCLVRLSEIEGVAMTVLITHHEVHWFLRIPAKSS